MLSETTVMVNGALTELICLVLSKYHNESLSKLTCMCKKHLVYLV